jgi:hypothetical protein
MFLPYRLIATGHSEIGFTKPPTKNTGANLSTNSSTPPHPYQIAQQTGDHIHPGVHAEPPTLVEVPPLTMRTTKMTVTHPSHHHEDHPPPPPPIAHCRQHTLPPLSNTMTQNDGSMAPISAVWLDGACLTCSKFSDLDWKHPRPTSKSTTNSFPASTTPTKMTPPPLVSPQRKTMTSSNSSTMLTSTSMSAHNLLAHKMDEASPPDGQGRAWFAQFIEHHNR